MNVKVFFNYVEFVFGGYSVVVYAFCGYVFYFGLLVSFVVEFISRVGREFCIFFYNKNLVV